MTTVRLARLSRALVESVHAAMDTEGYTALPVYDIDSFPQQPADPYVVIEPTVTGFGWDLALDGAPNAGTAAVQVTAVASRRDQAAWCLDELRRFVTALNPASLTLYDPTTLTPPVTTRVKAIWSAGTPSPPIVNGTLVTVAETFYLYVEAS